MSDKANPKDDNLEEIFLPNPWNRGQSPYDIAQKNAKNNEKQTQIFEERNQLLKEQNQELKNVVDKMQCQIDTANATSNAAKRQSRISIIIAVSSLIVSAGIAIAAWLVPPSAVYSVLASLFAFLTGR